MPRGRQDRRGATDGRERRGVAVLRLYPAMGPERCRVVAFPAKVSKSTARVPPTAAMRSCMLLSPAPVGAAWGQTRSRVADREMQRLGGIPDTDGNPRRSGVLGCIVDRREAGEIDRALDLGPAAAYPARRHRDRLGRVTAGGDQCRTQSFGRQQRRIDATCQRTDLVDGLLDLVSEPFQCRAGVRVAALLEALRSEREANPQPGQTLLNSVVEVSLDALAIGVAGSEHAARQPQREYPRQRLQQSAAPLAGERHRGRRGLLR